MKFQKLFNTRRKIFRHFNFIFLFILIAYNLIFKWLFYFFIRILLKIFHYLNFTGIRLTQSWLFDFSLNLILQIIFLRLLQKCNLLFFGRLGFFYWNFLANRFLLLIIILNAWISVFKSFLKLNFIRVVFYSSFCNWIHFLFHNFIHFFYCICNRVSYSFSFFQSILNIL